MKYHVKYYDERRNLIGGDEWHAPPGTSYLTIGMEMLPDGPSPVAGYQLTDAETAEVLEKSEQRTQAHARRAPETVAEGGHPGYPVEPGLNQPIFGRDGREVGSTEEFPLTSFCRCGRQITQLGMNGEWEHSD